MKRFLLLSLLFFSSVFADKATPDKTTSGKITPDLLQIGLGAFDFHRHNTVTGQASLEYKWSLPVYGKVHWVTGAMGTFKGSLYLYSGFDYDFFMGKHFAFTPSFAGGLYLNGKGKRMGYPLEWRSSVEFAYVFDNQSRLGVQGYHISNGSMSKRNPGEESLLLFYSIALP